MRAEILTIVGELKVPFLTHFTRVENLHSIMERGLVPRATLDATPGLGVINDEMRLDRRRGHNCLSIAFPNSLMFYRFRQDNPEADWVVLLLPPNILARDGVLFCKHNAANAQMARTPDCDLTTAAALRGLFEEIDGHVSRAEQRLKSHDPTDVQAEVMVPGVIEADMIKAVVFPSKEVKEACLPFIGDRKPYVNDKRGIYATRDYYRTWGAGAS